ncbi:fimbrial protein [Citrobacter sp. R56]|uniref:fimbrial protein n=1 Tax=Citrobacter sp. R56 TaxID=1573676 RepID=UPI00107B196C|nr:fimbrial protein [Citrobacter sp. R56]QRG78051.1 fimbrial protein [Citrobacter sp. R56]
MNLRYYTLLALLMISGSGYPFSHPLTESTTLWITGRITLGPCIVDNTTANQTVDLGTAFLDSNLAANHGSEWKTFHLDLKSCPVGLSTGTVTLSGPPADQGIAFANSGSAHGIVLQLSNSDHSVLYGNGDSVTQTIDASRNVQFEFAARMYNPGNIQASKGDFSAAIQVDFTYQ